MADKNGTEWYDRIHYVEWTDELKKLSNKITRTKAELTILENNFAIESKQILRKLDVEK